MIAFNAQPILDARLRGFKPDGLILVSMTGHVEAENHVVRAMPATEYDWRWVHGLELCVYVADRQDWVGTLKAIALHRPAYLCIWNCHEHWGAKVYLIPTAEDLARPVRQWLYELDFLPWMDFENEGFLECRTYNRTAEGLCISCK